MYRSYLSVVFRIALLGERQTEIYLPVIRMGGRGSCRGWLWLGRSLSLPVQTILPLALLLSVFIVTCCQVIPVHGQLVTKGASNYSEAEQAELGEATKLDNEASMFYGKTEYAKALSLFQQVFEIRQRILHDDPDTAASLNNIAQTQSNLAKYAEAETLFLQAVKMREDVLSPDHPHVAFTMNSLALTYKKQGRFLDAERYFQKALKIREKAFGNDHFLVAETLNYLGVLYYSQDDFAAAEPLYKRALAIRESKLEKNHSDTLLSIDNLGYLSQGKKDYVAAQNYFERALAIRKSLSKNEDLSLAENYYNLSVAYANLGKNREGLETSKLALAIREKLLAPDHPSTLLSRYILAEHYRKVGDHTTALPLLQSVLQNQEKLHGPEHTDVAYYLNSIGLCYLDQAKFDDAEKNFQRALEIKEKKLGSEDVSTAQTLGNLAIVRFKKGDYSTSETMLLKSIAILERKLGKDHIEVANIQQTYAGVLAQQSRFKEVEPILQTTLRIREKTYGAFHPLVADSLNNIAVNFMRQGDYNSAETHFLRALAIREKNYGSVHQDVASSLHSLGALRYFLGNFDAAEANLRAAIQIRIKIFGENHPLVATTLTSLGAVYGNAGVSETAETCFQRALKIQEQSLGPDHIEVANTLLNLAALYTKRMEWEKAEPLYQRALPIIEKTFGAEHLEAAKCRNGLGWMYQVQHRLDEAEPLRLSALEIFRKSLGSNHPETLELINEMSSLYLSMDRISDALKYEDEYRQGTRRHIDRVLSGLSTNEQTQFLRRFYVEGFQQSLNFGMQFFDNPQAVDLSAAWLVNGKAVAQEAMSKQSTLARDLRDPAGITIANQLKETRRSLATLAMTIAAENQAEPQRKRQYDLLSNELRLSRQLKPFLPLKDDKANEWVTLEQLRQAIPGNAVFIDYARIDRYRFDLHGLEKSWDVPHYVVWISQSVGKNPTKVIDLGDAKEIDELVKTAQRQIQAASGPQGTIALDTEEVANRSAMKSLGELASKIWFPIIEDLGSANNVTISPDGDLWLVPWTALPAKLGSEKFILEDYSLRLVVSGRDLVKPSSKFETQSAVVVANPLFEHPGSENKLPSLNAALNGTPPPETLTTRGFLANSRLPTVASLPNTAVEAIAIQPNMERYVGKKATLYQDAAANEKVIKKIFRPKVLSFATHGFFLSNQVNEKPKENDQGGTGASQPVKNASPQNLTDENPLLRCGLLLAGCNDKVVPLGEDDGILTGAEIIDMDLRGTELVVLSACETGLGDVKNGEGVAGLRQAFQLAGAQTVIATLWQVPDRDSALIMSSFFENLADGQTKSTALRNAQLDRIESRRQRYGAAHPFYWAAWTITGS